MKCLNKNPFGFLCVDILARDSNKRNILLKQIGGNIKRTLRIAVCEGFSPPSMYFFESYNNMRVHNMPFSVL